jgi:hypothetical protein
MLDPDQMNRVRIQNTGLKPKKYADVTFLHCKPLKNQGLESRSEARKKPGSESGFATLFGGEKTTLTNKLEVMSN